MADRYQEIKDCHMGLVTGDDGGVGRGLLNWLNTKGAFVVEEVIPADLLLG